MSSPSAGAIWLPLSAIATPTRRNPLLQGPIQVESLGESNTDRLRTRAPRTEEGEEVGDVDVAVGVDVRRAGRGARTPCSEQAQQVRHVYRTVIIDISKAQRQLDEVQ